VSTELSTEIKNQNQFQTLCIPVKV